jgi:hypothetical protein
MKKVIISLIIAVCAVCVAVVFFYRTPERLASKAEYIPEFFNLDKAYFATNQQGFCIDEIHSQGRKFDDFGSAGYLINIKNHSAQIIEALRSNPNAVVTDSTITLTIVRDKIQGRFNIDNDTTKASVEYIQLYDD